MSFRLIALAGRAGAGKDTVAAMIHDALTDYGLDGTIEERFARPIYDGVQAMFGLDVERLDRAQKEAVVDWIGRSPRALLQLLGTEFGRELVDPDIWVRCLEQRLGEISLLADDWVVVTDLRFPNELAWVRRKGGAVWWVERHGIAPVRAHASEQSVTAADCSRVIKNLGTLDDLATEVVRAVDELMDETPEAA